MPRNVPLDAKLSNLIQDFNDSRSPPKSPREKRIGLIAQAVKLLLILSNTILIGSAFSLLAQDHSLSAKLGLVLLGLSLIPTFLVTSVVVPILVRKALLNQ